MGRRVLISDETVNSYGFYLLNSGGDMTQYKKNNILLWMHNRPWRGTKDEVLALGTVDNVSFNEKEQRWEGDLNFDMKDEFAAKIAQKWDDGIYKMVSAGIRVIEQSSDAKYIKPGQRYETATKWALKEVSVVDIGSNPNSLALYDEEDNVVNLSENPQEIPIKKLILKSDDTMEIVKLADGSELTVAQVQELADKAKTAEQTITQLTTERNQLQTENDGFKLADANAKKAEATALVDAAVLDGRIDATGKESYLQFFESNHEAAKTALTAIPKRKPVRDQLKDEGSETELEQLTKLSWDEIDRSGKLETVKTKYYDLYESKFETKFGHKPSKK
ncbi:MAG TPA: hypothetical protein DCR40_18065 [Prolixibacteraceae bacterium]|nr:hypothetical protein [Prolixibacteraceae bacterium]